MIKRILHITRYLLVAVLPLLAGCSEDVFEPSAGDGSSVAVTFRASIDTGIQSRAISDGTGADRLLVAVYEGETPVKTYSNDYELKTALTLGIELRLLSEHNYKVLFWAYNGDNTAYKVSDQGVITADYTNYLAGGFAKMEQLDAFYAVSEISVSGDKSESVTLTRPFAQLNFADNLTRPETGTHRSEVTINGVATSFNALTDETAGETRNLTFSFTDFPDETLTSDSDTYYYIATNYLFVPASGSVTATCRLKQAAGGSVITERVIPDIALTANKRTNVFGNLVQQPEDIWDGITLTQPETDEQNRYIIDECADLAWLVQNGKTLAQNSTFVLTKDLNMAEKTLSPVALPQGSTIEGGGHTVKNLSMNGGGLFGDATDLTVKELTVDKIAIKNADNHTGALVNTLCGNGAFSSVTVKNATVATTNGAAGGMVGYVVRKSEKDRSETLALTFNGCRVENSSVSGTLSEGKFVGLLSGYDLKESVSFATDCSVSDVNVADFTSPYTEGNEGAWLAANDYTKYNGWLGDEKYSRGTVNYGGVRFIPCWDGSKKVTPLEENGVKLIYSAFDLAALQDKDVGTIKLMENVCMEYDLDGASKDDVRKNIFTAISTLSKLEGNYKTIYNISIRDNYYGGFVKQESCATTFENITFDGADIRVSHNTETGDAYCGTLRGFAYAKTIITNVHVKNGYLNGVNKIGGLCGGIFSEIICTNNSVTNYSFENYDSKVIDKGFKANGEIGGLIGFISVLNASVTNEITNCYVESNKFNCITYNAVLWDRSVAPFIGDIRTQEKGTVKINNCAIKGQHAYTNAETGKTAEFDKHKKRTGGSIIRPQYTYYPLVGQCYAVTILDTQGNVYIDETKIF